MEEGEGDKLLGGDTSIAGLCEQALGATSRGDMQNVGEWQLDGILGETLAGM